MNNPTFKSDYFAELFCQDIISLNHRIAIGVPNFFRAPGAECVRTWSTNFKKTMTKPFTLSTKIFPELYVQNMEVFVKKHRHAEGHIFKREFEFAEGNLFPSETDGGMLTYEVIDSLRREISESIGANELANLDDCDVSLDTKGVLRIRLDVDY